MPTSPTPELVASAVRAAHCAGCRKSRRGVVAFIPPVPVRGRSPSDHAREPIVIGVGWNGLPRGLGRACDGSDACRVDCPKICVHAEVRAIRDAHPKIERYGIEWHTVELLHVELDADGKVVACDGPKCWQCSREILDLGVGHVWLFEISSTYTATERVAASDGAWCSYTALEFHQITLKRCGLFAGAGASS